MQIPGLDTSVIQANTAEGSFERGEEYFRDGAVMDLERRERAITARVKGHQPAPYTVNVHYDDEGITEVECTCPFHKGTWCRHIVAALLAVLDRAAEDEPAVTEVLETLERDALVRLVERLVAQNPELADWVRTESEVLRQ